MKIKPIAKYHIQTSEEIRRIVVALAAEYDTFPSETVSAIRDELKGLFIAWHQSDSKYQENPDATIRRMLRLSDAAGKCKFHVFAGQNDPHILLFKYCVGNIIV